MDRGQVLGVALLVGGQQRGAQLADPPGQLDGLRDLGQEPVRAGPAAPVLLVGTLVRARTRTPSARCGPVAEVGHVQAGPAVAEPPCVQGPADQPQPVGDQVVQLHELGVQRRVGRYERRDGGRGGRLGQRDGPRPRAGDPGGRVVQDPRLAERLRRAAAAHQRVAPLDQRLAVVQRHGAVPGAPRADLRGVAAGARPGGLAAILFGGRGGLVLQLRRGLLPVLVRLALRAAVLLPDQVGLLGDLVRRRLVRRPGRVGAAGAVHPGAVLLERVERAPVPPQRELIAAACPQRAGHSQRGREPRRGEQAGAGLAIGEERVRQQPAWVLKARRRRIERLRQRHRLVGRQVVPEAGRRRVPVSAAVCVRAVAGRQRRAAGDLEVQRIPGPAQEDQVGRLADRDVPLGPPGLPELAVVHAAPGQPYGRARRPPGQQRRHLVLVVPLGRLLLELVVVGVLEAELVAGAEAGVVAPRGARAVAGAVVDVGIHLRVDQPEVVLVHPGGMLAAARVAAGATGLLATANELEAGLRHPRRRDPHEARAQFHRRLHPERQRLRLRAARRGRHRERLDRGRGGGRIRCRGLDRAPRPSAGPGVGRAVLRAPGATRPGAIRPGDAGRAGLGDRGQPGRLGSVLRAPERGESLAFLPQRPDLRRHPPLQELGCVLQGVVVVRPPVQAAGRRQGEARRAQLRLQEPERLDPAGLTQLVPLDPVLQVQLPAPGPLPGPVRLEPAVPQPGELAGHLPARLQAEPAPADERLDRGDGLLDPARLLPQAGLDVEQQQVAEVAGCRGELPGLPGQRHAVHVAQVGDQRAATAVPQPVVEPAQVVVAARHAAFQAAIGHERQQVGVAGLSLSR